MYEPGQQPQSSGDPLNRQQGQQQSQDRLTYGDQAISNGVSLPFIEAFVDQTGESVTVLAACNWQGHSLADIVVNRRGKQALGAAEEFTIVDPRVIPNPALNELRQRQIQVQQQRGQTTAQGFSGQYSTR